MPGSPGFCFLPKYSFPLSPTKGCHAGKLLATAKKGRDMKITSKRVLLFKKKRGGREKQVNKICVLVVHSTQKTQEP